MLHTMKKIAPLIIFFNFFLLSHSQHTSSFSDPTIGNSKILDSITNISYELYNISNGTISVPISLTYNGAGGIKVNEIASRVGLGWSLSAGGHISRIVVGYPDDEYKDKEYKEGILFNNNLQSIENLNTYNANKDDIEDITKKDFEPDIFSIVTPTFSARFIFGKNNKIICIDNPNLKITHQQNSTGKLISFHVVDESGLQYTFDQVSSLIEKTNFEYPSYVVSGPESIERSYNSIWHLSKIRDPWSNHIQFTYAEETFTYQTNKVQKAKVFKKEGGNSYPTVVNYDFIGSSEITQTNKVLNKITTSQGENIRFISGSSRLDLSGSKALKYININDNTILYEFFTGYHGSSSNNYRLSLNKINKNQKFFLKFTYAPTELPPRLSTKQDFWGYFNNSSSETLIPKVYIDENSTTQKSFVNYGYSNFQSNNYIQLEGADRIANMNAEACILKEIENKNGGKRIYEYELNDFIYNELV